GEGGQLGRSGLVVDIGGHVPAAVDDHPIRSATPGQWSLHGTGGERRGHAVVRGQGRSVGQGRRARRQPLEGGGRQRRVHCRERARPEARDQRREGEGGKRGG